jgi:hypothetical protein
MLVCVAVVLLASTPLLPPLPSQRVSQSPSPSPPLLSNSRRWASPSSLLVSPPLLPPAPLATRAAVTAAIAATAVADALGLLSPACWYDCVGVVVGGGVSAAADAVAPATRVAVAVDIAVSVVAIATQPEQFATGLKIL